VFVLGWALQPSWQPQLFVCCQGKILLLGVHDTNGNQKGALPVFETVLVWHSNGSSGINPPTFALLNSS